MPGPILLEIDHVEMTGDNGMEWSMEVEEVLGGTGRATLTVHDRTNTWEPEPHWDVKVSIRLTGWVLFRGEIITTPVVLDTGMPWRMWKIDCADYNAEFEWRLVGAFDGRTWEDADGLGDYINVDPNAHSLKTDRLTVQHLLDEYIRVDGEAFETDTYVDQYLDDLPTIYWSYSTLQKAIEEMASNVVDNLQFWADPDLYFHWAVIPAWQDLLQRYVTVHGFPLEGGGDETEEISQLEFGEIGATGGQNLAKAPFEVSDSRGDVADQVGATDLQVTFDGSAMAEQIYVRGATGYVYNAPAIEPTGETIVINPEGYGSKSTDTFQITFLSSTKVWHKNSSGYIDASFDMATGGPYKVEYVTVPVDPSSGRGGHFWKMLEGPYAGKLADNDSNYFAYGTIRVEKIVFATTPPQIGIGGSGWVNEIVQDRNKRQAFLEAQISTTQGERDSIGGQALYRGSFPTLRGAMKVQGQRVDGELVSADGWRSGQLVKVRDARLPESLNDKFFVIQRVRTQLIEGTDVRTYSIDWGDGPTSRYTMQPPKGGGDVPWPNPVNMVDVEPFDLAPGPSSTQIITGQLMSKDGSPWKIQGRPVSWTLQVYDAAGAAVTGQGTLTPQVSVTDRNGKARTTLTTGATTGLVYFVFAAVQAV